MHQNIPDTSLYFIIKTGVLQEKAMHKPYMDTYFYWFSYQKTTTKDSGFGVL